jgi:hypothetical protein
LRSDESALLFYLFALPLGYICDIYFYKLKGLPVPQERSRVRFEHNRAIK